MKIQYLATLTAISISISMGVLQAGVLSEAYQTYSSQSSTREASDYLSMAAEEEVSIAKKQYLPRLNLEAKQLFVGQDIDQETSGVFQDGYADYGNTRLKLELDQPIIDLTLKHKVAAAEAAQQVVSETTRINEGKEIEHFITTMLIAARFANLDRAMDRVIERLEKESITVTQNYNEQLATLEDLENVRAAFSAMRQEKRAFHQQVKLRFFELGLDDAAADELILKAKIELATEDTTNLVDSPEISTLQAQINVYDNQIKAARMKDAPRLSLYGLYGFDDAGGSQFGAQRTLNGYEVGLAVSWNVFDRGINRAEARRLSYLRKAKEVEMRAAPTLQQRAIDFARKKVADAKQSLKTQGDQVAYQDNILKSTERSYREGGDKSYINMVNAFLTYEAIIRQQIHSEFDYIQTQVELAAAQSSWSPALIKSLDELFVSAE